MYPDGRNTNMNENYPHEKQKMEEGAMFPKADMSPKMKVGGFAKNLNSVRFEDNNDGDSNANPIIFNDEYSNKVGTSF